MVAISGSLRAEFGIIPGYVLLILKIHASFGAKVKVLSLPDESQWDETSYSVVTYFSWLYILDLCVFSITLDNIFL